MLTTIEKGDILLADTACDPDERRAWIEARGAFANIIAMARRKTTQVFRRYLYRSRNLVERFFDKLKHFRAIATRYDRRADNFLASVQLASIRIWINAY